MADFSRTLAHIPAKSTRWPLDPRNLPWRLQPPAQTLNTRANFQNNQWGRLWVVDPLRVKFQLGCYATKLDHSPTRLFHPPAPLGILLGEYAD